MAERDDPRAARMWAMVEQAAPALRETARQSETGRQLAPPAMDALVNAGIVRALLPAAYHGAELGPICGVRLFEELATIDSAAAWVGMISAAGAWLTILLPPQAGDEILADPRAVVNGSLFPPMIAEAVPGGYRVHGRTTFASGCNFATWFGVQAVVIEGGAPAPGANGMPAMVLVHVPAEAVEVIDTWHTLGMRGTGSHDIEVRETFVPEHMVWQLGPFAVRNPAFTDALSRMGLAWFAPLVASVGLGVARAAVSGLIDLAQTKTPSFLQGCLADKPVVQDRLARARATLDASRSYLYSALAEAEDAVRDGQELGQEQAIPLALAATHAVEAAGKAVDLVHQCAGASGIREEMRFQQYFRDVHTISQHAFVSSARFESTGKLMLGRESDWPFFNL